MSDAKENLNFTFPYEPRRWQLEAQSKLKRFNVVILHRRAGKSVFAIMNTIMAALTCPHKNPVVFYLAGTREQVKKTAWTYFKDFLADLRNIEVPVNGEKKSLVVFNESDLTITFNHNNAVIYLQSYENGDNLKGTYLDFAVLDEYQLSYVGFYDEVIRPMLSDRKGKVIFSGTIKGRNQLWQMMEKAKANPENWGWYQANVYETDAIDPAEIELIKKDTLEEKFKQEYMLDPDAQVEGAFFGAALEKISKEGRIIEGKYDVNLPVVAGLDVGLDGTGIWYLQHIKGVDTIIDVDFFKDKDASHTIKVLSQKPWAYSWILLPHDGADKNAADKSRTYEGTLKDAGFKAKAIKRVQFLTSIQCARDLLSNGSILKTCAEKLLNVNNAKITAWGALGLYCAKAGSESEQHDDYSHLGSALRTLATGLKENMTEDKSNPFRTNKFKSPRKRVNYKPYR